MPDNHVYRIIQIAGSSENSIEDAIQNAVGRASRTLRQIGWFEVLETIVRCGLYKSFTAAAELGDGNSLALLSGRLHENSGIVGD